MGLDMMLYSDMPDITDKKSFEQADPSRFDDELAYWRKANMIHNYFMMMGEEIVRSVLYRVTLKDLLECVRRCTIAMMNQKHAPDILPTRDGFFFGSTGYDDWYFANVAHTIAVLGNIISDEAIKADEEHPLDLNKKYLYYASW